MRRAYIFLCAPLLAFAFLLLSAPAHAQDPDYSDTPDILQGQNYLFRTDDIVVLQIEQAPTAFQNGDNNIYLYEMLTANGAITSVQAITSTVPMTPLPTFNAGSMAVGRMFDLPNDVVAVLAMDEAGPPDAVPLNLTISDPKTGNSIKQQLAMLNSDGVQASDILMADFDGDGYDELAVTYMSTDTPFMPSVNIVKATDPLSLTAGLTIGPAYVANTNIYSLAAARLGGQHAARLLLTTQNDLVAFNVDPQSLALTVQSSVAVPGLGGPTVAAGNFDLDPDDDEAVVSSMVAVTSTAVPTSTALLYDFQGASLTPVLLDTVNTGFQVPVSVNAAVDKVHWLSSDSDAVVMGASNLDSNGNLIDNALLVYTVENGQLVQQATLPQDNPVFEVALGNFDHRTAAGAHDPDLQLAVLTTNNTGAAPPTSAWLQTFNIGSGGAGYTLTQSSALTQSAPLTFTFGLPFGSLATGNLQGRSLKLGSPTKITIDGHSAPRTVVGLPPMHLDWVVPSCSDPNYPNNCSTPQVVNILASPSYNWAQFNTQIVGSIQSSSHTSTGGSLAVKGDASATLGFGISDLSSVSVEVKDSVQYVYATTVNTDTNSYATFTFDTSTKTGFADHVWFDSSRINIWSYRIIGETACPVTTPNCAPGQQQPLYVQFSGPDQLNPTDFDGSVVEWYQPPWEPGNLLSYPWTEAQLLASMPRTVATNKSGEWGADSSSSDASVTWTGGVGQQFSSGTTQSLSNDFGTTVSGSTSILGFDASGSIGFDADTANATETLGVKSNQNGSSTGFEVRKSGQGVDDYVYAGKTYILSQGALSGTLVAPPIAAQVPMTGVLRLAYWVNPFGSQAAGPWWPRTYALPDVALNHPQRWSWTTSLTQGDIMTFNPVTSTNPVTTTTSPFDQEFYYMRGLFVTDAKAPQGPQLTTGTVTQTLLLQARIYNYSHLDMNDPSLAQPAARVKVRFYGQLFKAEEGVYPLGASFLITETSTGPIPGFASTTTPGDLSNWRMVAVPFNPLDFSQTQNGNVFLRFWVVTWMEDAAGHLVQEMAGHGLTADPEGLTINTLGDVPVEPYSNNAGTYKQVYYIQPPNVIPAVATAAGPLTVTLSALQTAPPSPPLVLGPLGKYLITATVHNGGGALSSAQLFFSDGDPAHGGTPFEWESIPYVGAGAQYVSRVTYTPQACGDHTVYVTAVAGSQKVTSTIQVPTAQCAIILPLIGK